MYIDDTMCLLRVLKCYVDNKCFNEKEEKEMFEGGLRGFLDDVKNGVDCAVADAQYEEAKKKRKKACGNDEDKEYKLKVDTLPNGVPIGLNVVEEDEE